MKGDFTRQTFDRRKHYRSVLMQQGRVQLDADWNEQQAIHQYHGETTTRDVVGLCGAPIHDPGFAIGTDGDRLIIGKGCFYVDGILCENDTDLPYDRQPDFPGAPDPKSLLADKNTSLAIVYLDVWERHITPLDDPRLREVALNGADTTTRKRTVSQVKLLAVQPPGPDVVAARALVQRKDRLKRVLEEPQIAAAILADSAAAAAFQGALTDTQSGLATLAGTVALSRDTRFPEWDNLVRRHVGTLNARARSTPGTESPCRIPPRAGYQALENQLYRVEIHEGGRLGQASFKWSRDNGTVVAAIETLGKDVTVQSSGPAGLDGFASDPWVEVVDDWDELHNEPGEMTRILKLDPDTRVITLQEAPQHTHLDWHPKLRRWDGNGVQKVEEPTTNDGWIPLEDGVEIHFAEGQDYYTGDYWLIPARVATGEIEWPPYQIPNPSPEPQPPLGIRHHYCRLGLLHLDTTAAKPQPEPGTPSPGPGPMHVDDYRLIFPPLTELPIPTLVDREPGIQITAIHLNSGEPLQNDASVAFASFASGLTVTCRPPEGIPHGGIDPGTVKYSANPATVQVTLEIPYQVGNDGVPQWGGTLIGFQPLILAGTADTNGTQITWRPRAETSRWLQSELAKRIASLEEKRVLARLRLKGNFIRDKTNPDLYLDGETWSTAPEAAPHHLRLPSGDGRRGGDFEMWFWLYQPGRGVITHLVPAEFEVIDQNLIDKLHLTAEVETPSFHPPVELAEERPAQQMLTTTFTETERQPSVSEQFIHEQELLQTEPQTEQPGITETSVRKSQPRLTERQKGGRKQRMSSEGDIGPTG
jgi:hypothetical protein